MYSKKIQYFDVVVVSTLYHMAGAGVVLIYYEGRSRRDAIGDTTF